MTECADAVALINTTTGDLLRNVKFLPVPPTAGRQPGAGRGRAVQELRGGAAGAAASVRQSRRFVAELAVGRDADPAIADFVFELFAETPPAGRGGWARVLVDSLGPQAHLAAEPDGADTGHRQHARTGCCRSVSSRRIAGTRPNLASFVELPGGHCAILEHPDEVNAHLRALAESVREQRRISSLADR